MNKKVLSSLAGIFCCFFFSSTFAQTSQIAELLKQNKKSDAYNLAKTLEAKNIGDPAFDLQYGKAALAMQKPEEAALAFERVLIADPTNAEAKLGLELTYGKLGINVPTITSKKPFYIRFAAGYDDNISHATNDNFLQYLNLIGFSSQILEMPNEFPPIDPIFPGTEAEWITFLLNFFDLNQNNPILANDPWIVYRKAWLDANAQYQQEQIAAQITVFDLLRQASIQKGSYYLEPLVGIRGSRDLGKKITVFADLNAQHRQYLKVRGFDISEGNLTLGSRLNFTKATSLEGILYYQEYLLNERRLREVPLFQLSLSHMFGMSNSAKIYADAGVFTYPSRHKSLDTNMYLAGLSWTHSSEIRGNILFSQAFYGMNQARHDISAFSSNHFIGGNITDVQKLSPRTAVNLGFTYQHYLYNAPEFINSDRRQDNYWQYELGFGFNFKPNWTWRIDTAYSVDRTNINLYQFRRFEVATSFNYGV